MLDDSSSELLLTQSKLARKLNTANTNLIEIDLCNKEINKEKLTNPETLTAAEDPAYIIYTSGSTGIQKESLFIIEP